MHVLAGDIGGTKTILQLAEAATPRGLESNVYDSHAYTSLELMVRDFIGSLDINEKSIGLPVLRLQDPYANNAPALPICPGRLMPAS